MNLPFLLLDDGLDDENWSYLCTFLFELDTGTCATNAQLLQEMTVAAIIKMQCIFGLCDNLFIILWISHNV
jgi:hypothetical protein